MKKFIALVLALVLCLSLAACGAKKETGTKLAVQKGTTSFMYADMIKNVTVVPYDTFALAANDMKNGNADYVVVDKTTGNAICKEITGLKIIDIALSSENYGIAIDPNQADLKTKIDGILTDKAAEIDAIKEKYMNGETAKYVGVTSGTKDVNKAAQQLVVATNAEFAPLEYKEGYQFYEWDDGYDKPVRYEKNVTEDRIYVAFFVPLDADSQESQDGQPSDQDSDQKKPQKDQQQQQQKPEQSDQEQETKPEDEKDKPTNMGGGKYEEVNQIIDGETYYKEVIKDYQDLLRERLETEGDNLTSEERAIIESYLGIV